MALVVLLLLLAFILGSMPLGRENPSIVPYFVYAYVALAVPFTVTYRKVFDFQNGRLTIYRTALGLKLKRTVRYKDISSVSLRTVSVHKVGTGMAGPVEEYELGLITSGGKKIHIDTTRDYKTINSFQYAVSKVTGAPRSGI
jgi:hypothetical protein